MQANCSVGCRAQCQIMCVILSEIIVLHRIRGDCMLSVTSRPHDTQCFSNSLHRIECLRSGIDGGLTVA